MVESLLLLSPLEAYDASQLQKRNIGLNFREEIIGLHRNANEMPACADLAAWQAFKAMPEDDDNGICRAYREVVMRFGVKYIDPVLESFGRDLEIFYKNYAINFPIREEQETLEGFEALWRRPLRDGFQEVGYSVLCPLTGTYLMGINFTIQAQSDSIHFVYGFVSVPARGIGGLSSDMITFMRRTGAAAIDFYFTESHQERPEWFNPAGPLILFEKNKLEEVTLTDILIDSAGVDIDDPPTAFTDLSASGIGQSLRDFVWDRRGGKVIDYTYLQSSLDGVVRVPEQTKSLVIDFLCRRGLACGEKTRANEILRVAVGEHIEGCTTLSLCAFVDDNVRFVCAAQIRKSNEIFQGISVVKDACGLGEDIYFLAQMDDLSRQENKGAVALRPIKPIGGDDFFQAEEKTRDILGGLTWIDLRENRDQKYGDWLARPVQP